MLKGAAIFEREESVVYEAASAAFKPSPMAVIMARRAGAPSVDNLMGTAAVTRSISNDWDDDVAKISDAEKRKKKSRSGSSNSQSVTASAGPQFSSTNFQWDGVAENITDLPSFDWYMANRTHSHPRPIAKSLLTIGVGLADKTMLPLLSIQSPLPASNSVRLTTGAAGVSSVAIHVFMGERQVASENNWLARFVVNITSLPKGLANIDVRAELALDGKLTLTATEGKNTAKITLDGDLYCPSQEAVALTVARASLEPTLPTKVFVCF
jgi:hypothetical protein